MHQPYLCTEVTDGQVVRVGVSVTWMYCHNLEVMNLNPGQVEVGVRSILLLESHTWSKNTKNSESWRADCPSRPLFDALACPPMASECDSLAMWLTIQNAIRKLITRPKDKRYPATVDVRSVINDQTAILWSRTQGQMVCLLRGTQP